MKKTMLKFTLTILAALFLAYGMPEVGFDGFTPEISYQSAAHAKSKSVKVKSYKTKKGKRVKSHKRSSPKR